jgi:hypothetical protein
VTQQGVYIFLRVEPIGRTIHGKTDADVCTRLHIYIDPGVAGHVGCAERRPRGQVAPVLLRQGAGQRGGAAQDGGAPPAGGDHHGRRGLQGAF